MRWTDTFLDQLRNQSDDLSDTHLKNMLADGEIDLIAEVFKKMNANDAEPLHKQFPALEDFFNQTSRLPAETDYERIKRGEEVFARHAFPAALVMLTKSLPEGYAAPNLSIVLNISKNLEQHAYRRLLQVLQMLLNVCALGGFSDGGRAVITAQKLRLLHSGIRHIAHRQIPGYSEKYGVVINHEDMLATIMGFSLLVIQGLRRLNCGLTAQEEEDYFYLWQVYSVAIGLYPPEKGPGFDYIPDSVADAEAFYQVYARRHYRPAAENPDGLELTRANQKMLQQMVPSGLRLLGFGYAPRIYSWHLLGPEAARRVGIKRVAGHSILKPLLFNLPHFWSWLRSKLFNRRRYLTGHHFLGEILFQDMINQKFGHDITFTVPDTLSKMKKMVMH